MHPNAPLRIGVLISGSGSNLQALIDAVAVGTLDAEIGVVVSSRPDAYGLRRAQAAGIPTVALNRDVYADRTAADERIVAALKEHGCSYVIMAGYMRMVTPVVLDAYPNRVVNLHPALLPAFQGAHAIDEAFERGVKVTGVTVHFANEEYDRGPIIAQRAVEVAEGEALEALEARIHEVEHRVLPEVVQWIAEGRVSVGADGKVAIAGA